MERRGRRLRGYYGQFEDVDERAANEALRAQRVRERELALTRVPELDLSSTEWPELPSSEIVNAAIATARGRVNGYPDRHAQAIRRELARRHAVEPERIAFGNGAAELLQAAAQTLLGPDDELVTPWPSYPLYPLMAARAGGRPVPVAGLEAVADAVGERTRLVVVCNPNDPTGAYTSAERIAALASRLPERVHLVVDEALVQFVDTDDPDAVLRLTDAFPRLLVVRTFSKIYGLSGLRAGYAVGSSAATALLDAIAPVLGVNSLTQSAIGQALRIGDAEIARRRESVRHERARLTAELAELPLEASASQANFVWLAPRDGDGPRLAASLARAGVRVAAGGPLGADDHVRATIRDAAATDRLLSALRASCAR